MGRVISVLIVDDDPLVRAGLALILGGAEDIALVGQAGDGGEALATWRRERADVVLMDIRMPHLNGLEATEALQRESDPPAVIVLTTFDDDGYVLRALAAGASGFLLKDTPPSEIVEAVRKVAAGDPMLSPSVTAQLIKQVTTGAGSDRRSQARQRLGRLTDRETEVAIAIGDGLSNAEIAGRLHMSVPTVKAHVTRLFGKLDATNRVQIAICVHDAGLAR